MNLLETRTARGVALGLSACLMAGFGLLAPASALADATASGLQFVIVSDDIRKQTQSVERPGAGTDSSPDAAPENGSVGSGGGNPNGNNGHGNNADGVDSSNPGQGGGGPNGAVDPSGDVDDEAGGGGASPSKNKKK